MTKLIKRYWRGEEKLWKVFWIWNFLAANVLSLMAQIFSIITIFPVVLMLYANRNFNNITSDKLGLFIAGVAIILISTVYFIWSLVSLWRSAFNCSKKIYGYLARGWVVVIFFSLVAPAIGIIFPNSVFNDLEDEILKNKFKTYFIEVPLLILFYYFFVIGWGIYFNCTLFLI